MGDILPANIHGTGIVIDGRGVLIRGPSGAGKSLLALWLIDHEGALLVGDDRLEIADGPHGLTMQAPARLAGHVEMFGRGIVARPHVANARVELIVDLVDQVERMPEDGAFTCQFFGRDMARAPVPRRGLSDGVHQVLLVKAAVAALFTAG